MYRLILPIFAFLLVTHTVSSQFSTENLVGTETNFPEQAIPFDLDGDGDIDVLTSDASSWEISWYSNNGGGNFGTKTIITTIPNNRIRIADLDLDGDVDIFIPTQDSIVYIENLGLGNLSSPTNLLPGNEGGGDIAIVDLDQDGDMDIVLATGEVIWFENLGSEIFGSANIISTTPLVNTVKTADLDADGDIDIAASGGSLIFWSQNDGLQNFGATQTITTDVSGIKEFQIADLNNNGHLDILSESFDKLAWYDNDGLAGFSGQNIISDSTDERDVHTVDIDEDGDLDVFNVRLSFNIVTCYENDGAANFPNTEVVDDQGTFPSSVRSGDIDGDGFLDIIVSRVFSGQIVWYRNLINDSDNDGIDNADDCAPNDSLIYEGATCDDADPLTENDVIQADCTCAGSNPDADGDGINDDVDNCPGEANPGQEDLDSDGDGDVCDSDIDDDGILNENDCDPFDALVFPGSACDDGDAGTENDVLMSDCTCVGFPIAIEVDLKACIEGPLDSITFAMDDSYRANGLIPLTEPYTTLGYTHVGGGGEVITQTVLDVTGAQSVVDWIFIELRDADNTGTIIGTASALMLKDGSLVATDGTSNVIIPNPTGVDNVLVALRYRNHLPVCSDASFATDALVVVDFTDINFIALVNTKMKAVNGIQVLMAGDANNDGSINTVDKNDHWRPYSGTAAEYYTKRADFNLDGVINAFDNNSFLKKNNGQSSILD